MQHVIIVGAGLAGCECAYQLARQDIKVTLYEKKEVEKNPAQSLNTFAELVCSNSFRNSSINSAIGLLHQELRILNSLIISSADKNKIPAGEALAVDRIDFSEFITDKIKNHPNINIINAEFVNLKEVSKDNIVIIATGPLTSEKLSKEIIEIIGEKYLYFFDAIAPIVYKDSIDFNLAWLQSRYDKGQTKDYINCSLTEEEYNIFYNELINAKYQELHDWEASEIKEINHFEGCLPIEVMAKRGNKTLLFGPMKPKGLIDPNTNEEPFAVVQLRQDNKESTLFNIVGFQTKLIHKEQKRIFRLIPALKNAEFAKLGTLHKNTFINSPKLLNKDLSLKTNHNIFFTGQITGCEGYVESTALGYITSLFISNKIFNKKISIPRFTALGSIYDHVINGFEDNFKPSNINLGLFPKLETAKKMKKADRVKIISETSLNNIINFKNTL